MTLELVPLEIGKPRGKATTTAGMQGDRPPHNRLVEDQEADATRERPSLRRKEDRPPQSSLALGDFLGLSY